MPEKAKATVGPRTIRRRRSAEKMNSRLQSVVERMRLRPDDIVLEVGCGHGVAADLICQRLSRGRLVAIDRSAEMVAASVRRNARHLSVGLAEFHVAELEEFDPGERRFDVVLAIRVGIFHREPERARAIVSHWLKPHGRIVAEFDEPR
jgi:ubiquinone/menaquinone biosynthesis C-methylase UbiE